MASPAISEASEVRRRGRQRWIGAVALVAILVVFVPMVLDSEPRPPRPEQSLAIPPKSSAPPLPAPPPAQPAKAAEAPTPPAAAPAKTAVLEKKQVSPVPPPSATPPVGPAAAAPKLEGFAVQVGAFRDEAKLAQARQKLAAAGVTHYTERLEAPSGALTRLRAGPFPTRDAAEAALATLKRAALDGKVVSLP